MPITTGYDVFIASAKKEPHYSALLLACYNAVDGAQADPDTEAGDLAWIAKHFRTEQQVRDTLAWFIPFIICQSGMIATEGRVAEMDLGAAASVVRQTIHEFVIADAKVKAAGAAL